MALPEAMPPSQPRSMVFICSRCTNKRRLMFLKNGKRWRSSRSWNLSQVRAPYNLDRVLLGSSIKDEDTCV
ncbi:hypothetical protein GQ457_01G009170 [Hibiscus cannabinus]